MTMKTKEVKKKLFLHKKTIMHLNNGQLWYAKGGSTISCHTCETCGTCDTCTCNKLCNTQLCADTLHCPVDEW